MQNTSGEKPQPIKKASTMQSIGLLLLVLSVIFFIIAVTWYNIRAHMAIGRAMSDGTF